MLGRTLVLLQVALSYGKPRLTYFGIAGRGELARLYAHVGGLDYEDNTDTTGYKTKTPIGYLPALADPEGGLFPNCTFAFGCLQESLAVERYMANLAPVYAALTATQKAIDDMFAMVKEDLIHVEPGATNASAAPAIVTPLYDRYLPVLESLCPASGFVNGLAFPTGADLALLVILKAVFPYAKALKNAGYDASKFEKVSAIVARTAAFPSVAAYLKTSKTFYADL